MSATSATLSSFSSPCEPATESHETTMAAAQAPKLSLTLILAATPSLGIGKGGGLPWPMLKKEMGYFARVTKRVPPPMPTNGIPSARTRVNAVVMGRKTWDSIPEKFRPLKGRLNVVVTRDAGNARWKTASENNKERPEGEDVEGPIIAPSISAALESLRSPNLQRKGLQVERVFVIGGASIYKAALELPETDRVLLTKIETEFECDTHFPVDLDKEGWRKVGKDELEGFVGEEVQGVVEEKGLQFEFCLYEKV